jgi:DNA-binding MarR family transcriptional regulator
VHVEQAKAEAMADHVDFILKQWRTQRPDLDVSPMGIVGRLTRLSRLVGDEIGRTFNAHGLDRPSFDVLATLYRAGPPHRLTPLELMRASMVTSGAITQRLDRLEDSGLVKRTPSDSDGRGVHVTLTEKGLLLIKSTLPDHLETENRILSALSRKERADLAGLLRKLLEALGDS